MNSMTWDDAIQWVHRVFGEPGSVDLGNLSSREMIEALIPLDRPGLRLVAARDRTILRFLWAGVVTHDRWSVPGPFVVQQDSEEWFEKFLARFRECDPRNTENLPAFDLHRIKNRVYARRAWSLLHDPGNGYLFDLRTKALRLRAPSNPESARHFNDERSRLLRLIDGLLAGKIVTFIETSLPILLDYRRLMGTAEWRGLSLDFSLEPHPAGTEGWTASQNAVVEPTGASRWGAGKTKVRLRFRGLIDGQAWTPPLSEPPDPPGRPHDGWPNAFSVSYYLLYDLAWGLFPKQQREGGPQLPVPRDISSIDYRVREIDSDDDLEMSFQQLGGWTITALGGTTPPEETIHLGEIRPPSYWQQCLTHARANVSLGETRQALLWANMGVEALLDQRLEQLADESGNQEILEQLQGGRLVFREAEEVLSSQYPEMAGKVKWPDRQIQLSRFTQLKYAYRLLPLAGSEKEAIAKYSVVSRGRNDLIHGRAQDLVPVDAVREAIAAVEWLAANLVVPQRTGA